MSFLIGLYATENKLRKRQRERENVRNPVVDEHDENCSRLGKLGTYAHVSVHRESLIIIVVSRREAARMYHAR